MGFPRRHNGIGMLGDFPPLRLDQDGKLSESTLGDIEAALRVIRSAANGRLTLGNGDNGSQAGNLDAQALDFVTPTPANTEFVVQHGLGRVPVGYIILRKSAVGQLFDSNAGSWTDQFVLLKFDQAAVTVKILLF